MGITANGIRDHGFFQLGETLYHRGWAEQCVGKHSGKAEANCHWVNPNRDFTFDKEAGQHDDGRENGDTAQALAEEMIARGGKCNAQASEYQNKNHNGTGLKIIEAKVDQERVEQADCNEDQANTLIIF